MAAALRPDKTLSRPSGGGGESPGTPLMTLPAGQQFSKAISLRCVCSLIKQHQQQGPAQAL